MITTIAEVSQDFCDFSYPFANRVQHILLTDMPSKAGRWYI
ncbi:MULTISPECIES: hypothetical protein [Prevotellaceae]|nr:hypothetical protein [Prevotella phocaeensis]